MSLTHDLADLRQKSRAHRSGEIRTMMDQATDELARSGIIDRSLKVGEPMPAFALPNATGRTVHSAELLAHGPLVVNFYRGGW